MKKRGVEFLYVPGTYYDTVGGRVGQIEEDMNTLMETYMKGIGLKVNNKEKEDMNTVKEKYMKGIG